jgi:hypothetical protein
LWREAQKLRADVERGAKTQARMVDCAMVFRFLRQHGVTIQSTHYRASVNMNKNRDTAICNEKET